MHNFFREVNYIEGHTIQYCTFEIGLDSSFSYCFGQNSIYVLLFGYEREAQNKYGQYPKGAYTSTSDKLTKLC